MSEFNLSLPIDELADAVALRLDARRRWAHVDALADYLGCDVRRVRDLRERGLPALRHGKRLIFDLREVDAWIEREGVRV
jgi:phage terminase Nu1 subunit (DNA packaging protein)